MDKLIVEGPGTLSGEVLISRAKNAYLPILAGVLLNKKPIHLKNLPDLADIRTMIRILEKFGVKVSVDGNVTTFDASCLTSHEATYDLVKTMRASIFTLGPLLARLGKGVVSLPGGCAIGSRPINLHLDNLRKMGAQIDLEFGNVVASVEKLKGVHLVLAFPSVGATENLMMAAVFCQGSTVIENCALEPEIEDLGNFLNSMGAKITGLGTKTLTIIGVEELHETTYEAIGDRIEAGTYIMGALMTGGEVEVKGFNPEHLEYVLNTLKSCGANLEITEDSVKVFKSTLKSFNVDTAPFPGFPTDLQAQAMALATTIDGMSIITETIFENRFMHVPEMARLGAKITLKGKSAIIEGKQEMKGAPIMCTDLRASAALVLTAMVAKGKSLIQRIYHLDRGYEKIGQKLKGLGMNITRDR